MSHTTSTSIPKKQKKVLIIAGSPNVLKHERNLDYYDIIIKLNCIPQDPQYDKYISSRCDIWAFSSHLTFRTRPKKQLSDHLLNNRMQTPLKWVYSAKLWRQFQFKKWSKSHPNINPFQIISLKQCMFFHKKHKFKPKKTLSTGMATIIHAMVQYKDITLLGFTSQLEENPHFYDSCKPVGIHDFKKENQIIENWIATGKLKTID